MLGFGIVGPVLPQYIAAFGVTYTIAGLAISVFPLARMIFNFPAGILTDRIGRRRPLLIGITIVTVAALLCGLARNIYEFIAFRFMYGAGTSMFIIVANVLIADIAPAKERGKYLSYYQGTFRFGSIFGPAIGGLIAEVAGLRAPFFFLTLLGSISLFLTFLIIKEEKKATHSLPKTPIRLAALLKLIFDRRLIAIEFTQMVSFITMSSIRTTMVPFYGVDYLQLPLSAIGTILSVGALVSFPILMLISNVVDRIQRNVMIALGFFILATSVYSYTIAYNFEGMLIATVCLSVAQVLINPSKVAIIGDITTSETRGFAMGAFRTAGDIGFFVGPTLAGYLTDNIDILYPFYVVTGLCLLSSIIAFYSLQSSRLKKIVKIDM